MSEHTEVEPTEPEAEPVEPAIDDDATADHEGEGGAGTEE